MMWQWTAIDVFLLGACVVTGIYALVIAVSVWISRKFKKKEK